MNEAVLIDTGFWIALFDERDPRHAAAIEREDYLDLLRPVVPWPVMYETLRTRFVRRPAWVAGFDQFLHRPGVVFIDDTDYCEAAYAQTTDSAVRLKRPLSMVDVLCRLLIEDPNVRVDFLLTTNPGDFADVCLRNGVEIL